MTERNGLPEEREAVDKLTSRVAKLWERWKAEDEAIPDTASGRWLRVLQLMRRVAVRQGANRERLKYIDSRIAEVQARINGGTDRAFEQECDGYLDRVREWRREQRPPGDSSQPDSPSREHLEQLAQRVKERLERQKEAGDHARPGTPVDSKTGTAHQLPDDHEDNPRRVS